VAAQFEYEFWGLRPVKWNFGVIGAAKSIGETIEQVSSEACDRYGGVFALPAHNAVSPGSKFIVRRDGITIGKTQERNLAA
jgi:hypothetical protein